MFNLDFIPTKYQQAVLDFIITQKGHGFVEAVAGSGKTTTIVWAAIKVAQARKVRSIRLLAFNQHIAKEITAILKEDAVKAIIDASGVQVYCTTIHSMGRSILAKNFDGKLPDPDDNKYKEHAAALLLEVSMQVNGLPLTGREVISAQEKLVEMARLTLTDPESESALREMVDHYSLFDIEDLELPEEEDRNIKYQREGAARENATWQVLWRQVSVLLAQGAAEFVKTGRHDFADMVFLPNYLGQVFSGGQSQLVIPQFDLMMVDEAQDLNEAQRGTVMLAARRGRVLFVGDRRQAIYGFAGADTNGVQNIIERLGATVLPLSICWRCGDAITLLAKQLVPQIEPAGKHPGIIRQVSQDDFLQRVQPGQMVIGRTTAPLVKMCLALLRMGKRAQVRGRDLGATFTKILKRVAKMPGFSLATIPSLLDTYLNQQIIMLSNRKDADMAIEVISDQVETMKVLYEAYCDEEMLDATVDGLIAYFKNFFKDTNEESVIILCTIHRAKGLERKIVWLISPDLLPHPMAKQPWEREQEYNLAYVAFTRAKEELNIVGGWPSLVVMPEGVLVGFGPQAAPIAQPAPVVEPTPAPVPTYLEQTDICPGCGSICDLSGYACWACGQIFNREAPRTAQPLIVVEPVPAPVVEAEPEDWHPVVMQAAQEAYQHGLDSYNTVNSWQEMAELDVRALRYSGYFSEDEEPLAYRYYMDVISELASAEPEPEPGPAPTPALLPDSCEKCHKRAQIEQDKALYPFLSVLCDSCYAEVIIWSEKIAHRRGVYAIEATYLEAFERYLGIRKHSDEEEEGGKHHDDRMRDGPRRQKAGTTRIQITLPDEYAAALKAAGDPATIIMDLMDKHPEMFPALASQSVS